MTDQNTFNLKQETQPMKKSSVNPWARDYEKSAKKTSHTVPHNALVITNGTDTSAVASVTTTYAVDKEKFCKLYLGAVEAMVPLTSAGRKVFVVLFNQLRKNIGKDMVPMAFLHVNEVSIQIKQGTYTKGVRDLYDNYFIAPVEGLINTWWVNPDYIFNGSRLNINNTYILEGENMEDINLDTGEIFTEAQNEETV